MKHLCTIALVVAFACCLTWWGCSGQDKSTVHDEYVDMSGGDAKTASEVSNPYLGKTEEEYIERFGSGSNVTKLLQLVAEKFAEAANDSAIRADIIDELGKSSESVSLTSLLTGVDGFSTKISEDFKSDVSDLGVTGDLGTQVIPAGSDEDALMKVAHVLYGLRVLLVMPKSGVWSTDQAMPVYYNPTTDEDDTDYYQGYNPDGTAAKFDFEASDAPYPFLYVHQDEKFFRRPENRPSTTYQPADPIQQHFGLEIPFEKWLLPTAAFADNAGGHHNCYHDHQLYLTAIRIHDNHEGNLFSNPEIFTRTKLEHANQGGWNNGEVIDPFDRVNDIDVWYDGDNVLVNPVLIFNHAGYTCDFYPNYPHPDETDAKYRVLEEDPYPNPHDKMSRWNDVATGLGNVHLDHEDSDGGSWAKTADIVVHSDDS